MLRIIGMMFVYNETEIVGKVIDHLFPQGIELVVVDNGSNDGSFEIIKEHIGNGIFSVKRMKSEKFDATTLQLMTRTHWAVVVKRVCTTGTTRKNIYVMLLKSINAIWIDV